MIKQFRSVAVTVTPFIKENKPDLEEIALQTAKFGESGIDAIFPCASTGEYVKMSAEDKCDILKTVAVNNKGKKALVAGACAASASEAKIYIETAKKYNYDACVVCPPYYFPQSQSDIFEFYKEISDFAEGMPIIAYHVPFFTSGIELDTFRRLLELPEITGIKDSSANMKRIAHCCDIAAAARPDFGVYTGTDDCLLPALCAGCKGSMTALAATMPTEISAVYKVFDAGDLRGAMEIQRSLLRVIREADSLTFPIGYKLLAKATGLKTEEIKGEREQAVYNNILRLVKEVRA